MQNYKISALSAPPAAKLSAHLDGYKVSIHRSTALTMRESTVVINAPTATVPRARHL